MSVPTTSERRLALDALDDLTFADAHRIRRQIDKLGRGSSDRRSSDQGSSNRGSSGRNSSKDSDWASVLGQIESARARVERRLASVPTISYPAELPVSAARDEIADAIAAHQVVVIAGETGSGKTTQIPKICLELGRGIRGAIGHTQPRRIAASSVARRIADETGTEIGDAIGFSVRFTDKAGADTLVKVMTDGILLREMASDPLLRRYDTLIIDEAHERSLNIDFILGYLKRILPKRPDLKVIITSATIEPDRFAKHFTDASHTVPVLEVSGRTFPVEIRYRPLSADDDPDADSDDNDHADLDQIAGIDRAIDELWSHERGDILVFLPTERDIRDTADALTRRASQGAEIVPLFARLSIADQQKVFSPSNGRRIVLATNVAETSLTVPGIRYVIDTGTARISRYSTRTKVNRLPIEKVSQASARQRAGRCGRVAPGICIRLYSERDFDSRDGFTDPEILRTNLAAVILQMLSLRLGDVADFPFVQPPDERAIRDGMAVLTELGAIEQKPDHDPRLTNVGRTMARLPVDPRIGRMLTAAHELGCLDHVLVIAAALSIPDVRERPAERRGAADEAHRRFDVDKSEFLSYLEMWRYLDEQRSALSNNKFRRLCESEFIHYLRVREWWELHRQLRSVVGDLDWSTRPTERDADAIHRSILSGLLGNIADRRTDSREYTGARNTTLLIFPGSALAKKPPAFIMAAEILETSRLFAHTVASIDPLWVENLAGNLAKRTYSEPHWSAKQGAAMAYERVTLYGVVLVAQRRVHFGSIDAPTSRALFIRHALVEGDWHTNHRFFQRNRDLLDAAEEVEHRARRRDIVITEDQLFDFYDQRVGADVVSARHFDTWWKQARRATPELLDLRPEDVAADTTLSDNDFPGVWQQGETRLELRYRFEPGAPDDGVTVVIPEPLLAHVRPAGFDWSVPGLRSELATELVKSLPKTQRKSMAPAQRFADLALSRLTPRAEPLVRGLARELSTVTGMTISPDDFDPSRVPAHLLMNFAVTTTDGSIVASGKSLPELRSRVDPAPQAPRSVATDWTADTIGILADEVTTTVAGQPINHYPAVEPVHAPAGQLRGIATVAAVSREQRATLINHAVVALLELQIAPLTKKAAAGLDPARRLALSQNPYRDSDALFADCTRRAIRDLTAGDRRLGDVREPQQFRALLDEIGPRARALAPDIFRLAVDALTWVAPVRRAIDDHVGTVASDDVAEQLDHLVFDGFVLATPAEHLADLARYLEGAVLRLDQLPASAARDAQGLEVIDRVTQRWNQRLEQLPRGRRDAFNEHAQWLVEELRVGLFAQRLGTRGSVSEKRVLRALDGFV